jgi:hypothetical protein
MSRRIPTDARTTRMPPARAAGMPVRGWSCSWLLCLVVPERQAKIVHPHGVTPRRTTRSDSEHCSRRDPARPGPVLARIQSGVPFPGESHSDRTPLNPNRLTPVSFEFSSINFQEVLG